MRQVTVKEATRSLGELIRTARTGEEVVIASETGPLVRLVPVEQPRKPRAFGSAHGLVEMADDFDAPLEGLQASR